jgi:hypothetical protein
MESQIPLVNQREKYHMGSDVVKPGSAQARAEFFYYCFKSSIQKISRLDLAQLKKIKA